MFFRKLLRPAVLFSSFRCANNLLRRPTFCFTTSHEEEINSMKEKLTTVQKQKGQFSQEYGIKILQLAQAYQRAGQIDKAVQNYLRWTQVVKKVFGEQHHHYLTSLRSVVQQCISFQQFGKAFELLFMIRNLEEKIEKEPTIQQATTAFHIAIIYKTMRNIADAEKWMKKACEIAEQTDGKNLEYLMPLIGLGSIEVEKKNFDSALEKYEEGIEIFLDKRQNDDIPLTIEGTFFEIAKIYWQKNNKEKGIKVVKQLVEITNLEKIASLNDFIGRLNQFYIDIGIPLQGIPTFNKILDIIEKRQGKNQNYAFVLASISTACIKGNEPQKALSAIKEAKQIYTAIGKNNTIDFVLLSYTEGTIKSGAKQYEEAIQIFQDCLNKWNEHLKEEHVNYRALIKTSIGKVYFDMKNLPKAIEWYKNALEDETKVRNYQSIFNLHSHLAAIYFLSNDFPNSFMHSIQNDQIIKKKFLKVQIQIQIQLTLFIVELCLRMNLLEQCAPYLEKQTKLMQKISSDNPKVLQHLERKGGYHQLNGDLNEAIQFYDKAIEFVKKYGAKPSAEDRIAIIEKRRNNLANRRN